MGCTSSSKGSGERRGNGNICVDDFRIERVIGQGGFGKVNAVILRGVEDSWYAMKKLKKQTIVAKECYKEVFVERDLLMKLKHPRICNSFFAFQDECYLYLVMDLALGGDLRYQLNHTPSGKPFSEAQCRLYVAQIMLALDYIHGKSILHRDIKPENILMDGAGWLKLTDFGIARFMDDGRKCYCKSGTHGYMAPEIYVGDGEHGVEADWFSLGVTACELLTKARPFSSQSLQRASRSRRATNIADPETLKARLDAKAFFPVSKQCLDFLASLLITNPKMRTGNPALKDPRSSEWFLKDSFNWVEVENEACHAPFQPDTTRMNANPNADAQEIFLGLEQHKLQKPSAEEQRHFVGYDYDYRLQPRKHSSSFVLAATRASSVVDCDNSHRRLVPVQSSSSKSGGCKDDIEIKPEEPIHETDSLSSPVIS